LRSQIVTSRFLGRFREQMAPHCKVVGAGPGYGGADIQGVDPLGQRVVGQQSFHDLRP